MFIIPENKSWVIYGIRLNKENSLYRYVGQTQNTIRSRFRSHKFAMKTSKYPSYHWMRGNISVGFVVEVLASVENGSALELDELEIQFISELSKVQGDIENQLTENYLLNLDKGGRYTNGYFTDEVRAVRSNQAKEMWKGRKPVSGENNPMFGTKGELSPNFGRTHSEETKARMSEARKDLEINLMMIACVHCNKTVPSSIHTRFHGDNCSDAFPDLKRMCPYCGKKYRSEAFEKSHGERCSKFREGLLECKVCGRKGTPRGVFARHLKRCPTTYDVEKLKCIECGFETTNASILSQFHNDKCDSVGGRDALTCSCGVSGGKHAMLRHHFDNCTSTIYGV